MDTTPRTGGAPSRARRPLMPLLVAFCLLAGARAEALDPGEVILGFSPHLMVPFGSFDELIGPGLGLDLDLRLPLNSELHLTASTGYQGFRRVSEPDTLSLDMFAPGVPTAMDSRSRFDTQGLSFKVGLLYPAPTGHFLWAEIGDLYTTMEMRTDYEADARNRRASTNWRSRHGLLLSLSAGLDRGPRLVGIRLSYSPAKRGPLGEGNLTWVSAFVGL